MLDSKGFDLWADGYDKTVGLSDESNTYPFAGYKYILNAIYKEVLSKQNASILDIGFGTGTLTTKLYEQGCHIWGLDFSQRMIELAKSKMPNANFIQGDFTKGLPDILKQQTYDFIIATYSLHHLTDKNKVIFIKSLLSMLKEKGKILIGDVAFKTRTELMECQNSCKDEWDNDEIYFVYDEIAPLLDCKVNFQRISFCAGILTINKTSENSPSR